MSEIVLPPRDDNRATLTHISQDMAKVSFIREWREHRGLKQEQLAEKAEMSKGYLSDLERGNKPYNQRTLEALSDILRCTPADLLSGPPGSANDQPRFDARLLMLSFKGAIEEAVQDRGVLTDLQRTKVVETAVRIYQAYTASGEMELPEIRGH